MSRVALIDSLCEPSPPRGGQVLCAASCARRWALASGDGLRVNTLGQTARRASALIKISGQVGLRINGNHYY